MVFGLTNPSITRMPYYGLKMARSTRHGVGKFGPGSRSGNAFLANGDGIQKIAIDAVAESRFIAYCDGPARRHFHRGLDNIASPVALAGRYIARQHEVGKRSQRDIVRAADAGFEHSSTPYGNSGGLSDVMHALGFSKSTDAAELDINDPASLHIDGLFGLVRAPDAFIQADGGFKLGLQLRVIDNLVVSERLLDHHQSEFVQTLEQRGVAQRVR